MRCYGGTDTSTTVDIRGSLKTRGETRCLGGVSVYWLFIKTYHKSPWHSERHTEIIDESLHEITEIAQMWSNFPALARVIV